MSTPRKPFGRPPKPAAPGHGEAVRNARMKAGMTLHDVASRVGTKETDVSKVELGKTQPSLEWLYRIAVAIGCPPSSLDARLTPDLPDPTVPPAETAESHHVPRSLDEENRSARTTSE